MYVLLLLTENFAMLDAQSLHSLKKQLAMLILRMKSAPQFYWFLSLLGEKVDKTRLIMLMENMKQPGENLCAKLELFLSCNLRRHE